VAAALVTASMGPGVWLWWVEVVGRRGLARWLRRVARLVCPPFRIPAPRPARHFTAIPRPQRQRWAIDAAQPGRATATMAHGCCWRSYDVPSLRLPAPRRTASMGHRCCLLIGNARFSPRPVLTLKHRPLCPHWHSGQQTSRSLPGDCLRRGLLDDSRPARQRPRTCHGHRTDSAPCRLPSAREEGL
jgi:hypothetical protein